jgi:hypothetical protein
LIAIEGERIIATKENPSTKSSMRNFLVQAARALCSGHIGSLPRTLTLR